MATKRKMMLATCAMAVLMNVAVLAQPKNQPPSADLPPAEAARQGKAFVDDLLARAPDRNTTNKGSLRIESKNGLVMNFPLRVEVYTTASNWLSRYETKTTDGSDVSLTVIHEPGRPNRYLLVTTRSGQAATEPKVLSGPEANIAFAGSDFSLTDLGPEFLHWPKQLLIRKQLRSGQSCNLVDSINPNPEKAGYSRVRSWLDIDTGGIVHADAYDEKGQRVKQFAPKEFKKVNGQWQLQEMQMRNLQTDSITTIFFEVK